MVYIYGPGQRYAYIHTRTHIQAEKTSRKAQLADRLINGLSGENTRWNGEIKRMESVEGRLVGDVLVAAAFVSYAGEHAVCGCGVVVVVVCWWLRLLRRMQVSMLWMWLCAGGCGLCVVCR
jgi:hypothetical protein